MIALCAGLLAIGLWLLLLPLLQVMSTPRNVYFAKLNKLRPLTVFGRWTERSLEAAARRAVGSALGKLMQHAGFSSGSSATRFQFMRLILLVIVVAYWILDFFMSPVGSVPIYRFPFLTCGLCGAVVWYGPYMVLLIAAKRRKMKLLHEISRLSHRLSVCMSGKTDLRDTLLRAGRTSRELQPYLSELAAAWNKNQTEAIIAFGERVGITEVYPLVNTLLATAQVDSSEVAEMLERQVESIDKTLEHEVAKKLENAPLAVIFLIMIPFMVVFALMVLPWMHQMSELLFQSF